jgi:predicted cupin superfamily sugar epimerase
VQLLIPGGMFCTARVSGGRRWFLGASTEWPGVEPADVELGNADTLAAKYPKVAAEIHTFPLPAKRLGHSPLEGDSTAPTAPGCRTP